MYNQNFIDFINILAFALGIENLQENRQQTADNDVNKANDRQAEYLLKELAKQFTEINSRLESIENLLKGGGKNA